MSAAYIVLHPNMDRTGSVKSEICDDKGDDFNVRIVKFY